MPQIPNKHRFYMGQTASEKVLIMLSKTDCPGLLQIGVCVC